MYLGSGPVSLHGVIPTLLGYVANSYKPDLLTSTTSVSYSLNGFGKLSNHPKLCSPDQFLYPSLPLPTITMRFSSVFTILSLFAGPLTIIAAPAPAPEAIAEAQPEAHRPHFDFDFGGPDATGGPDFSGSFGPRPTNFQGSLKEVSNGGVGGYSFDSAAGNSKGQNTFVQSARVGSNAAQNTGFAATAGATTAAPAPVTTS